jgi:type IV pilus assembly protein PilC
VLRSNLVARWCDAAKVGVDAGLDLPAAIELAGDATGSAGLRADGTALIDAISAGRPLTSAQTRLLPATVPAAMQFASGFHDLGATLGTLSEMYQRQAELRMAAIPGIVTPILVIVIAVLIGFIVLALMAPLIALIQGVSGGGGFKKF